VEKLKLWKKQNQNCKSEIVETSTSIIDKTQAGKETKRTLQIKNGNKY